MIIAVIADDLTGANATGVRLSKYGFKTATMLQGQSCPHGDFDAVCVDTDSRYVSPQEAKQRVLKAATLMRERGATIFCKRIDSTVRGNIGVEIVALLDVIGSDAVAIVMPSFPDSGRITVGGYLLVNGIPVQDTDVARDPISPITQSYVPALIAEQMGRRVAHIGLDVVLEGETAVAKRIVQYIREDTRIIVIDATSNEQIEMVAKTMANIGQSFVAVDPGPLSAAYAKAMFNTVEQGSMKILATVGSATELTGRQLEHLIHEWEVHPVYVNPEQLIKSSDLREQEIERAVVTGLRRMISDAVIVVTTHHPEQNLIDIARIAEDEKVSEEVIARRITSGLANISRRLILRSAGQIGGCFSSGGDVTRSLCLEVGAKGIKLVDEVFPLAAYGHLIGGNMNGMPIVTKGGLVGHVNAMSKCVEFLFEKLSKSSGKRSTKI